MPGPGDGGMVGAAKRGSRSTFRTNGYWQPGSGEPRKIDLRVSAPGGRRSPSSSNSVSATVGGAGWNIHVVHPS